MEIIRCKEMVITGGDGLCHLDGEPVRFGQRDRFATDSRIIKSFCATWVKERKIKLV